MKQVLRQRLWQLLPDRKQKKNNFPEATGWRFLPVILLPFEQASKWAQFNIDRGTGNLFPNAGNPEKII